MIKRLEVIIFSIFLALFSIVYTYAEEKEEDNKKENRPKVSIIVIINNTDKYLKQCLDSIVEQSMKEIEISCVSNHMSDNLLNISKNYKELNINFVNEEGTDLTTLINNVINKSDGEYISFVDANDYFKKDAYEIAYRQASGRGADILAFGYINNKAKKTLDDNVYNNPFTVMKKLLLHGCTIWGKLYKTELVKDTLFNERLKFSQDVCFNYSIFPKAKVVVSISDLLYYHRWLRYVVDAKFKNMKEKINNDIEVMREICKNWRKSNCASGNEEVLYKIVLKNILTEVTECDKEEMDMYMKEIKDIFSNDIFTKESLKKFPRYVKEKLKRMLGFRKKSKNDNQNSPDDNKNLEKNQENLKLNMQESS